MLDIYKKFVSDLNLPDDIIESLNVSRNYEEMKVFALYMPRLLYPDTYILAGRLYIYLNIITAPKNIEEYVEVAGDFLRPEIIEFLLKWKEPLDQLLEKTWYKNFEHHNILSASKCIDYLLRISRDDPPIETPCLLALRQAVQFHYDEDLEAVEQVYMCIINREFIHASPTMFNAGLRKNQLSSCFSENTEIMTYNRGPVKIIDVKIGDLVTTHKGNVKPVVQLHKNKLGDRKLYQIKVLKTPTIEVTGNHRFWASKNGSENPDWISVEDLKPGDYISIPRKTKNSQTFTINMKDHISEDHEYTQKNGWLHLVRVWKSIDHLNNTGNLITRRKEVSKIKAGWEADEDWAFFLGAWYGDGNIITGKKDGITLFRGIRFVVNGNNKRLLDEYVRIGQEKMGLKARVNRGTSYNKKLIYVDFHSGSIGKYFMENHGKGFDGKKISLEMYSWGYDELKSFVCGLFSTDGCYAKNGSQTITMSNPTLVKQIYSLLRNRGIDASYNFKSKEKVKLASSDIASVTLPKDYLDPSSICKYYEDDRMKQNFGKSNQVKQIDGHMFLRLSKKYEMIDEKPEYVYTLGVEDDHSYCVEGILAENCFLISLGDNLEDLVYTGAGDVAMISKHQGGIGKSMNRIRHSAISNTGKSSGVMPFARIYDATIRCVDQGGKRNGAATISLNDWHIDAEDFIKARDNFTRDGIRLVQANTALFVSSLFMKRVRKGLKWTLFCPAKAHIGEDYLVDFRGDRFEKLYHLLEEEVVKREKEFEEVDQQVKDIEKIAYSSEATREDIMKLNRLCKSRAKSRKNLIDYKVVDARQMYELICDMQVKSSFPYIVYADTMNYKNNTMNIGPTESSNLCLEITLPATPDSIASCNLGHLVLKTFVNEQENRYDYNYLGRATQTMVWDIEKVIKRTYYPLDERDKDGNVTKIGKIHRANIQNRPLGIGVSGLAEVFALLRVPYDSIEAIRINKRIFACMYFNALYKSYLLARELGEYDTFRTGTCRIFVDGEFKEMKGSPLSNGFFQFDLWRSEAEYLDSIGELNKDIYCVEDDNPVDPKEWGNDLPVKSWDELRELIKKHGVRHSMLLALMPTASSAQMVRNAETTEAHQTLIVSRKLVHGNYMTFSEPFVYDMQKLGLWNQKMIDFINISNGTIKDIHLFVTQNPDFFPNLPWSVQTSSQTEKYLPKEIILKIIELQKLHKGMFEISQKTTSRMARQRGIYVDQSQSFNIYIDEPSKEKMMSVHMYTDALRLKTGMYYLRANSAVQTGRFTVDSDVKKYHSEIDERRKNYVCTEDECIMCS